MAYENYKKQIIRLKNLIPDPLNIESNGEITFSDPDIINLSEEMKRNGFFGTIVAYPYKDHMYMIESGHRRYYAAVLAGFVELPVSISEPPSSILERRQRLDRWNDHVRSSNPLLFARRAQFKFHTYTELNKQNKAEGKPTYPVIERIAKEMDISTSNVTKYKMLLNLIPELQDLISSGNYNWSAMATASQLTPGQQKLLYDKIQRETRIFSTSYITGAWISREVDQIRHIILNGEVAAKYDYDRNDLSYLSDELKERLNSNETHIQDDRERRYRRKDGYKRIQQSKRYLDSLLDPDILIKDNEKKMVRKNLEEMQKTIRRLLQEMDN